MEAKVEFNKPKVEILAPAGSMESMMAAINAGADAVYMGGSRFGARAYADNPEEDSYLEAIDYAHLHGCRLYMTVNTLVKENELDQLYAFLKPYYERGLDAVIVQDMGVFAMIRKWFPDLAIHASTQMTITSYRSAVYLKQLGATRVVTARELSLEEISQIRDHVDIEIESFVHGALCYCYSGQCLLSSLIGGRSGNRGRCAQPCRLPYDVQGQTHKSGDGQKDRKAGKDDQRYVLSLKDMCTLDILPDVIEAGVYSLKIEGRMKSPRYTAGVVSIYRKYVDRYLKQGRDGYRVDPKDRAMLLELFDRGGFTEGYYRQHNGRDMVALKEKPAFREGNQALFDRLDQEYVEKKRQEPVSGHVIVHEGEPVSLELSCQIRGDEVDPDAVRTLQVKVEGQVAQTAQNQPLTEEKLLKQINKTGNSPFAFTQLTADVAGNCFLPVQALNELRRSGMEALEAEVLQIYRRTAAAEVGDTDRTAVAEVGDTDRTAVAEVGDAETAGVQTTGDCPKVSGQPAGVCKEAFGQSAAGKAVKVSGEGLKLRVSLENPQGFAVVADNRSVEAIYLDSTGFPAEDWSDYAGRCKAAGKSCALMLPHIFRTEAQQYLTAHQAQLKDAGFTAFVIRSMEEVGFLQELGITDIPLIFDANLYSMNHLAAEQMLAMGASSLTFPLELNSRELEELRKGTETNGNQGLFWELVAYGYLPAMVSAQCIVRTTRGCTKKPELLWMKDRTGKQLPVQNHCTYCYNTIYNPSPLSLLGQEGIVERIAPSALRLQFTFEKPQEIQAVLEAYVDHFLYGQDTPVPLTDFTRGHLKRGVE